MALFYAYQNRYVKWESMWVIFVEVAPPPPPASPHSPRRCERGAAVPQLFHYAATLVMPDSEFVTFELANGIKLPWLQYFGWVVTVPVLLMFLVSLTAHGGRSATVTLTLTTDDDPDPNPDPDPNH